MADPTEIEEIRAHAAVDRGLLTAFGLSAIFDFEDASLEWRRLFSELLGTFMLVLVGAGAFGER